MDIMDVYAKEFTRIENETMINANLTRNLATVDAAIKAVDDRIEELEKNGEDIKGFEKLKNKLFYLKYYILERL
jgi:hypothetical protein